MGLQNLPMNCKYVHQLDYRITTNLVTSSPIVKKSRQIHSSESEDGIGGFVSSDSLLM